MKLCEWQSTKGSKFHILCGIMTGIISAIMPVLFLGFAYLYVKYQQWDVETISTTQQKAWDVCEYICGAVAGVIIGITIKYLLI